MRKFKIWLAWWIFGPSMSPDEQEEFNRGGGL